MKVLLANPRGFCAGVNMAVECLDRVLEICGPPVYVYHEIVHNRYVVERFLERGAVFVESLEAVPRGSVLLYSAHGVSPEIRDLAKSRGLFTVDATCPLVIKVHVEALKFAKDGYRILLIGHAGHDEVIGTMGEAPDCITLVETVEDVAKLEISPETRLAYLTQTTLSVDEANVIIRALKAKFPSIVGPKKDDICYATQNRQEAVHALAPLSDLVLVLGSQNSSNSRRLAELAVLKGKPAYLIDGTEDIKMEWFSGVETVLVTAGASAPETVVNSCLQFLEDKFQATVDVRSVREEDITFSLPKELKNLAQPNA